MIDEEDLRRPTPRVRLKLMKSPVVGSSDSRDTIVEPDLPGIDQYHRPATLGAAGFATYTGEHKGLPIFRKFEDASLLELFTDLFFAASYTVFTQTQQVTNSNTLAAYIGYFCTLWVTWLLVALYDVRFVTDCVFERATRAAHLGVLIGFTVVAPKFDPGDQDRDTMRIMSIILCISRFTLMLEYLSVLWHVRKFKQALLPIVFQVAASFAAGAVYLGITFRFRDHNSRVFVVWYMAAFVELTIATGASAYWDVLAFTRTHLMKRLSLLTVIILGDGIIVLAQDVVKIVQTPHAWNSLTIGVVTASCAAIYSVFLVYFDWIREQYLPRWRQLYWVSLHLPFHLALVLFMHGFTQLIMWTKILDVIHNDLTLDTEFFTNYTRIANSTSEEIGFGFAEVVRPIFDIYGKTNSLAPFTLSIAVTNITSLPNDTWRNHPDALYAIRYNDTLRDPSFEKSETFLKLYDAMIAVYSSMYTSVFETYGVEVHSDLSEDRPYSEVLVDADYQTEILGESLSRFEIVFIYGNVASGLTLIIMVLLTIISRKTPWRPWPIIRNVINVLAGLTMACLAALVFSTTFGVRYVLNGMIVPTTTIIWFLILVLTHIGTATPVVAGTIRKKSMSPERDEVKRQPSDQRTLSWHGSGGISPGQMMQTNSADQGTRDSQTTFYGQVGQDGTRYGRSDRQSQKDAHGRDATHGTSTAHSTLGIGANRRPIPPGPVKSTISFEPVDRAANVSPLSSTDSNHARGGDARF